MKFIHLSDLHIGKRIYECSLLEDQEYILKRIINIIDDEAPDGVIIAGDIYDKSIPSADAITVFDNFLVDLSKRKLQVFIISGNHDSAERLSFGSRIMDTSGIHLSPVYDGNVVPKTMTDLYGNVNIYMLPFVKPSNVRSIFEDEEIISYSDAVRVAIERMNIDKTERNILVTHQFVTGAERSESEEALSVGGSDNVDADVFSEFDYVALGHIHGPQNIIPNKIRYCGTPLKYSFSEASHKKSVTVLEVNEKGSISTRAVPLEPKHDMIELKGTYMELSSMSFYANTAYCTDYVHITLTDEDDVPDAIGRLRVIYKNLLKLDYDNKRTRNTYNAYNSEDSDDKSPIQIFAEFYELQNNQPMSEEQENFVKTLINEIWEGEE